MQAGPRFAAKQSRPAGATYGKSHLNRVAAQIAVAGSLIVAGPLEEVFLLRGLPESMEQGLV